MRHFFAKIDSAGIADGHRKTLLDINFGVHAVGRRDALRQLENDAQALQAQAAADTSAQASLEMVQQQYLLGAASYLQLLTAQQQAQQTRIGLIAAQAARLADSAALYQAMGGGVLTPPGTPVATMPAANP